MQYVLRVRTGYSFELKTHLTAGAVVFQALYFISVSHHFLYTVSGECQFRKGDISNDTGRDIRKSSLFRKAPWD